MSRNCQLHATIQLTGGKGLDLHAGVQCLQGSAAAIRTAGWVRPRGSTGPALDDIHRD